MIFKKYSSLNNLRQFMHSTVNNLIDISKKTVWQYDLIKRRTINNEILPMEGEK